MKKYCIALFLIALSTFSYADITEDLYYAVIDGDAVEVESLLKKGAKVNGDSDYAGSLLCRAVENGELEIVQILIKYKADVNQVDESGLSPLHTAVLGDNMTIVKLLVENKADVNNKLTNLYMDSLSLPEGVEVTPLVLALASGNKDIADYLIKNGAKKKINNSLGLYAYAAASGGLLSVIEEVYAQDKSIIKVLEDLNGESLLHGAVKGKQVKVINWLLSKGANINQGNNYSETPFSLAISNDDYFTTKLLIEKGASLAMDSEYSPLQLAIQRSNPELIRLLLANGVDINKKDEAGDCPIFYIFTETNYDAYKLVLLFDSLGAKLDVKDSSGQTLLHYAAAMGDTELIRFLIAKGLNVNAVDDEGKTVLHKCSSDFYNEGNNSNLVSVLILLQKGVDINAVDSYNNTPLLLANDIELAKYLIDNGADINAKDGNGANVFLKACESGHLKLIQYYLSKGFDANSKDNNGFNALHKVFDSMNNNYDLYQIVSFLISKGVDVNGKNAIGSTPLHYAVESENLQVVQLFLRNKADAKVKNLEGKYPIDLVSYDEEVKKVLKQAMKGK